MDCLKLDIFLTSSDNPNDPPITKVISLVPDTERVSIFRESSSDDIISPSIHKDMIKDPKLILERILFPSVIMHVFISEIEGVLGTLYSSTSITDSLQ